MLALLAWSVQRKLTQNKTILQSERDIAQIKNAMLERESGF